jgi:hypothetical protein
MKLFVSIACLVLGLGSVSAQYHDDLMFGLRLGGNYSSMTNLTNMLVYDDYRPMYTFSETPHWEPAVSLFTHYRFKESQIAIEGLLNYSQFATEISKVSTITELEEKFDFRYHYMGLGLFTKVYLYRGLLIGVGANLGMCLNSSSGIAYSCSTYSTTQNMQSEENLRQALKGRAGFSAGFVLDYEFMFGLSLQASYYYGFTDMIETDVNSYNYIESNNHASTIQVSLGWAISQTGFYVR